MSGRVRWQRDGQTVVGYRKTDRRNVRRDPCERRQELIAAAFKKPDAAQVGMVFRLPDTIVVSEGKHGIGLEVLPRAYVRVLGQSSDHCCTIAQMFLRVVAKDRPGFTMHASVMCRIGEDAGKSYGLYLTVTRGSVVKSTGLVEPKLFEAA